MSDNKSVNYFNINIKGRLKSIKGNKK
jgi:hypothetical protein